MSSDKHIEIERKYLVRDTTYRQLAHSSVRIVQGYICRDPQRTVRVRIKGDKGYLTIKGMTDENHWSRYEFEHEITLADAEELLQLCLPPVIEKVRYNVPYAGLLIEVDEFFGDNTGLVMAEIELEHAGQPVSVPPFVGREVTADPRYYNVYLSEHPYKEWAANAPAE